MNRFLFLIAVICFFGSCQQRSGSEMSTEEKTIESPVFADQFIDGQPIDFYLNSGEIDQIVEDYYYGKISVSANEQTGELLNTLIEKEGDLVPLYYRCFMNICKDHGEDYADFLGNFCIKLLEEKTHYCIKKLRQGSPDYFTGLVANEVYKDADWEEEINNISLRLHTNLENEAPELRKELDLFIVGLKNDIEHLSNPI